MAANGSEVRSQVPMSDCTTWRCGGTADAVYVPQTVEQLSAYLATLEEDVPVTWLGRGSNVLIRDAGLRGVVIQLRDPMSTIEVTPPDVRAQGGALCASVATQAASAGLRGLEFLAGIPGTLGGALAMNAGAAGSEIWDHVDFVETIDRRGERHVFKAGEIRVGYRFAELPEGHGVVLGAFSLTLDVDQQAPARRIRELMHNRRATQPISVPSGGSVFRNPPGQYAAKLIEAAGLKGYCIGDAQVSPLHANFIVNNGHASAADIEQLIAHVQRTVQQHSGVCLELEVRILGEGK